DDNPPGYESLPTPHNFVSNPLVPDDESFPKVPAFNTGSLGGKTSKSINEESIKPATLLSNTFPANPTYTIATNVKLPAPDAGSFPKIPTCDTGRLLGEISESTNKNIPKPAQNLGNGAGSEYLPNNNYQVVKQKFSKTYSAEIANSDSPIPDATLPYLES
ncbi:hypothetical protein DSO57_1014085, partial [Entomophthora muscae]